VGAVKFADLIATSGSCSAALDDAPPGAAARARDEADAALERAARCGARVLARGEPAYPAALLELHDPPPVLFAIGDLAAIAPPACAIVGTRRATGAGERATRAIAAALAAAGVSVLSGMARGIDGVAHRAALDAGGRSAAVLGTGVDIAYPAAHARMHRELAERGLLLSEELPGDRASAGSFPKRNRILAALAQVTIVVEAPRQSGALITAGHALDLGRTVAAVPGPFDAPQSLGSNLLLRDGAVVIAEIEDALALFGIAKPRAERAPQLETDAERAVWLVLGDGAAALDEICARTGLPAREGIGAVTALEMKGVVEVEVGGNWRRKG